MEAVPVEGVWSPEFITSQHARDQRSIDDVTRSETRASQWRRHDRIVVLFCSTKERRHRVGCDIGGRPGGYTHSITPVSPPVRTAEVRTYHCRERNGKIHADARSLGVKYSRRTGSTCCNPIELSDGPWRLRKKPERSLVWRLSGRISGSAWRVRAGPDCRSDDANLLRSTLPTQRLHVFTRRGAALEGNLSIYPLVLGCDSNP